MEIFKFCFGFSCTVAVATAAFWGIGAGLMAGSAAMLLSCVAGLGWLVLRPAVK